MRRVRGWFMRVLNLFTRRPDEQKFTDELETNLQFHIDDNIRAGMSPAEARRASRVDPMIALRHE